MSHTLHDLPSWTRFFRDAEIPILAGTAATLELWRANEDSVDGNQIGEALSNDPLMSLKVLRHASMHRSRNVVTDTETVTAAVVMMGITPFFRTFGQQPTVQDQLADNPAALQGLLEVLKRAARAARFALMFAAHRLDPDAAVIHHAALLHDFADMLLWCHAPTLALQIAQRQRDDTGLRSAAVQQEVLGTTLPDLEQSLMKTWRLPELLQRITKDGPSINAQELCVQLAMRIARHSALSWDNPAIPDDVRDICALLNIGYEPAMNLLRSVD